MVTNLDQSLKGLASAIHCGNFVLIVSLSYACHVAVISGSCIHTSWLAM